MLAREARETREEVERVRLANLHNLETLRARIDELEKENATLKAGRDALREGIRERINQYRGSSIEHAVRLDFEKLLKETA